MVHGTVICGACEIVLEEAPGTKPEDRAPCPNCRSTARSYFEIPSVTFSLNPTVLDTLPSLLLKTVVYPGEATNEGRVIVAVALPWFEIIEELSRDPSLAHKIHHRKWEEIIAGAYEREQYDVTLTPPSADGGRDVIAVKQGVGKIRVIDQVKAYKPGHVVTANDARALFGVMVLDGASKGYLTTTSDFAPRLTEDRLLGPIIPSRIELVNRDRLIAWLTDLARGRRGLR